MITLRCCYPWQRHMLFLAAPVAAFFSTRGLPTSKTNIEQSLFDFDDSFGILLSDSEQAATEGTGCKS